MSLGYTGVATARTQAEPRQLATSQGIGSTSYIPWGRIEGMVEISGAFNGATVTLNVRHKDRTGVVIPVSDADGNIVSLTAPRIFYLRIPSAYEISLTVTGGTSPLINAYIN